MTNVFPASQCKGLVVAKPKPPRTVGDEVGEQMYNDPVMRAWVAKLVNPAVRDVLRERSNRQNGETLGQMCKRRTGLDL